MNEEIPFKAACFVSIASSREENFKNKESGEFNRLLVTSIACLTAINTAFIYNDSALLTFSNIVTIFLRESRQHKREKNLNILNSEHEGIHEYRLIYMIMSLFVKHGSPVLLKCYHKRFKCNI